MAAKVDADKTYDVAMSPASPPETTTSKESNKPSGGHSSKPIFGYYNCTALGEPIRMMLHYRRVQFSDRRYETPREWEERREQINMHNLKLPFYYDNQTKKLIHGSHRQIAEYLAMNLDLMPQNQAQGKMVRLTMRKIEVIYTQMFLVIMKPQEERDEPVERMTRLVGNYLRELHGILLPNQFVAGIRLTYVDFFLHTLLRSLEGYFPVPFSAPLYRERVRPFLLRMEALPGVSDYFATRGTIRVNPPGAQWELFVITQGPTELAREQREYEKMRLHERMLREAQAALLNANMN